ncbi:MAG TPA: NIPSNAP family protein [Gaiellaceae bacterium]|nr:NIPSNAP family protein [Gaiellaceae bacterium]HZT54083.1 NIPSNAP family protein [Gaiellaceae bacterium]
MFRHQVRLMVKPGELTDFQRAFKEVNAAAPGVGLPVYRLWVTLFGDLNEVWADAEYESLDGHVQAIEKARENAEWSRVFRTMIAHTVPGTLRDYPLEPVELS